jgi:hypothetical protein
MKSSSGTEYICGDDKDVQRAVVDSENEKIGLEKILSDKQYEAETAD